MMPPTDTTTPDPEGTELVVTAPVQQERYVVPVPAWQVTLDGQDLTEAMRPRLIELSLTEKRGEDADTLEITLHDSDGTLALPPPTATLQLALGWARGTGVTTGLVDKGTFRVDEISWRGPADVLTITARAADLTEGLRMRRDQSWVAQPLRSVVATIAGRNGLTPRVHDRLANARINAMQQHAKSDIAFIRELGRRYDAVATVKNGALIVAPIGTGTSVGGTPLPSLTIKRDACASYGWTRKKRDDFDGVEAQWHDQGAARRQSVRIGGSNTRRLRRTYANAADARAAAEAAQRRDARSQAEMTLTLAYGDASTMPERPVTLEGFKTEIDAAAWQIAELRHRMNGGSGFSTELTLDLGASE